MEKRFYDSGKPFFCDLIITEKCMLACKMCRMWQSTNDAGDIPTGLWQRFIDSLAEFLHGAPAQLQFVGGEPLMKHDVLPLIRYASLKGFSTTMTTNGYLIDRAMAVEIINSGLDTLVFSLDGVKSATHDYLRGRPGVFDRVVSAIELVDKHRDKNPRIHIVTTIMEPNLDELIELATWVNKDKRIENISFQAVMQPFFTASDDAWYEKDEFNFLWPKDSAKVAAVLDSLKRLKEANYRITNPAGQFAVFKEYFNRPERFIKATKCNLGHNALSVNTLGKIFLCMAMGPIGDIRDAKDVAELWFSGQAQLVREKIGQCNNNCKSMINCFFEDEQRL